MNAIDKNTFMIALKGAGEDLRSHFYRTCRRAPSR